MKPTTFASLMIGFLLSGASAFAQSGVDAVSPMNPGYGTRIFYGNGVDVTWEQALNSRDRLREHVLASLATASLNVGWGIAYNTTSGKLVDAIETIRQKIPSVTYSGFWRGFLGVPQTEDEAKIREAVNDALPWYYDDVTINDLSRQIHQYNADQNSLRRVLLVSHSQGNMYANHSYQLSRSAYRESFANVQVTSPSTESPNPLGGHFKYNCDVVIGSWGRPWTHDCSDPANVNAQMQTVCTYTQTGQYFCRSFPPGEPLWHGFSETYLYFPKMRGDILGDIKNVLSNPLFKYPYELLSVSTVLGKESQDTVALIIPGKRVWLSGMGVGSAVTGGSATPETRVFLKGVLSLGQGDAAVQREVQITDVSNGGVAEEGDEVLGIEIPANLGAVGEVALVARRYYDPSHPTLFYETIAARKLQILAAPHITSITPSSGSLVGGYQATITGSNFVASAGFGSGTKVKFGDVNAVVNSVSSTSIVVTVPPSETPDSVSVIVVNRAGDGTELLSTEPVTFTYASVGAWRLERGGYALNNGSPLTIDGITYSCTAWPASPPITPLVFWVPSARLFLVERRKRSCPDIPGVNRPKALPPNRFVGVGQLTMEAPQEVQTSPCEPPSSRIL